MNSPCCILLNYTSSSPTTPLPPPSPHPLTGHPHPPTPHWHTTMVNNDTKYLAYARPSYIVKFSRGLDLLSISLPSFLKFFSRSPMYMYTALVSESYDCHPGFTLPLNSYTLQLNKPPPQQAEFQALVEDLHTALKHSSSQSLSDRECSARQCVEE